MANYNELTEENKTVNLNVITPKGKTCCIEVKYDQLVDHIIAIIEEKLNIVSQLSNEHHLLYQKQKLNPKKQISIYNLKDNDKLLLITGNYYWALYDAVYGGYSEIIDQLFMFCPNSYDMCLYAASLNGHQKIFNQMLSFAQGREINNFYYTQALSGAALNGHQQIVIQLLALVTKKETTNMIDHNHVLYSAARGGHQQIVNQMLSLVQVHGEKKLYNWALYGAAQGGHQKIVDQMLMLTDDYNFGLSGAAFGGHQEIVNQMLALGANDYDWTLEEALGGYCYYQNVIKIETGAEIDSCHLKISRQMLNLGADKQILWKMLNNNLLSRYRQEIVKFLTFPIVE